jgi:GABA permease
MTRVLVVANETVGADELLAELMRLRDASGSTFYVIAPALAMDHGVGTWSQAGAIEAAQERLNATLAILRGHGLEADGRVGDMHPIPAIGDALREFPADRIVISTHPPARSRWLHRGDVVEKARKRFGLPVTHVISHVPEHASAG